MAGDTQHIPALPFYVTIIRGVQLLLSIIILGLVAFALTANGGGDSVMGAIVNGPLGFMIFCCVWAWILIAYAIVTTLWLPVAYNMWAHLAIEILTVIFWFCGWASLAAWAAVHSLWQDYTDYSAPWSCAAAGAGLAALTWISFVVTFVVFCIHLHRHRRDPANAELSQFGVQVGGEKGQVNEMGNVAAAPQQYPVQPQFTGQPQYVPTPSATPVQYPPVQPTPPPQQWNQSPPPAGYGQA